METKERIRLVAPCGIDCGTCELFLCKENQQLFTYLLSKGIPGEKLPCAGCRDIEGKCPVIGSRARRLRVPWRKALIFVLIARNFPCSKLNPSSDRADVLPHNLKVFNLCTIQREGVEGFIEISTEIRKKYYKGTMEIGNGPQL